MRKISDYLTIPIGFSLNRGNPIYIPKRSMVIKNKIKRKRNKK